MTMQLVTGLVHVVETFGMVHVNILKLQALKAANMAELL
jgi:hypothetical protein